MARSLLLLVIGAIAGGGAVYFIAAPDAEQSQPNEFASRPPASATPKRSGRGLFSPRATPAHGPTVTGPEPAAKPK